MEEALDQAIPAHVAYEEFVLSLPFLVDSTAIEKMTAKAAKKRALKIKYDNIIKWR
jgi:hypothetical protein